MRLNLLFFQSIAVCTVLFFSFTTADAAQPKRWRPGHYMLTLAGSDDQAKFCENIGNEENVQGIMARVYWDQIELEKNVYDWTALDKIMETCGSYGKLAFLMMIERSFTNGEPDAETCRAPQYIKEIDNDTGCMATHGGGTPAYQKPEVTKNYMRLLRKIAERYDQHPAFGGLQMEESAPAVGGDAGFAEDYTTEAYADQLLKIYWVGEKVFERGIFIASVNWLGNGQVERLVDGATRMGVGIGGPDLIPESCGYLSGGPTRAQDYLTDTYPGYAPVMFNVQGPELWGKHGYPCSVEELTQEGLRLGMSHYFWLRMWEEEGATTWNDDILPAIRKGISVREDCPDAFANGCSAN